jgi:hypothetical protein
MRKLPALAFAFVLPSMVLAYSTGPPNGMTGAPGEGTCVGCHTSFPLNSGNGSLSIEGPANFEAGQTYMISVHLSDPDQVRWGFEFTPLTLGAITVTDATNTQMQSSGGKPYVKHTSTGTHDNTPNGPTTWSFNWTAPADPPSEITFYAAGNASNSSGDPIGDYIYTTSFVTTLVVSGIDDNARTPNALALGNYPNPFNAQTNIIYELPNSGHVELSVYNITGQRVATLVDSYQDAGAKTINWDGAGVPSGIYFYRLTFDGRTHSQKMTLLK